MNTYPWKAYNHGLEGQGFHTDPSTSIYDLTYIAERLGTSCADFAEIYEFIIAWGIAVHGN